MKREFLLLVSFVALFASAQNAYEYYGDKVALETHYFESRNLGKLSGDKKQTFQGMDIWGDYMVSLQNTGIAITYKLNGNNFDKIKQFKLASFGTFNHANTVSFGPFKLNESDKVPPIYVSQCSKDAYNGMSNCLFVERLENNLKSSKLIQTIVYKGAIGCPLEWVVDRENQFLYAYMSTGKWNAAGKHRLMKFPLPALKDGDNGVVTLDEKDAIDSYLIESSFLAGFNPIAQGLYIHDGLLFIPAGDGANNPSVLYVWDLNSRSMRNVIDLSGAIRGEVEDCSIYNASLYVQAQGQLYKLIF